MKEYYQTLLDKFIELESIEARIKLLDTHDIVDLFILYREHYKTLEQIHISSYMTAKLKLALDLFMNGIPLRIMDNVHINYNDSMNNVNHNFNNLMNIALDAI